MSLGALSGVTTDGIQAGQVLQWKRITVCSCKLYRQTIVDENGETLIDLTPLDNIHFQMGVGSQETHMGNFPGSRLPDNSTLKQILIEIESQIDNVYGELNEDDAQITNTQFKCR